MSTHTFHVSRKHAGLDCSSCKGVRELGLHPRKRGEFLSAERWSAVSRPVRKERQELASSSKVR